MKHAFWFTSLVAVSAALPLASAFADDPFGNPGGAPAPEIGATAVGALLVAGAVRFIRSRKRG